MVSVSPEVYLYFLLHFICLRFAQIVFELCIIPENLCDLITMFIVLLSCNICCCCNYCIAHIVDLSVILPQLHYKVLRQTAMESVTIGEPLNQEKICVRLKENFCYKYVCLKFTVAFMVVRLFDVT